MVVEANYGGFLRDLNGYVYLIDGKSLYYTFITVEYIAMGLKLRPIKITNNVIPYAEGSCLFEMGNTKVLCVATVVEGSVPPHALEKNIGWITAEYSMLPRATKQRTSRTRTATAGRTQEIQRVIGRSLRPVVDLSKLNNITIMLDCDVIQADGGTRTAAINGSFIALADALKKISFEKNILGPLISNYLGAVSVGIVNGGLSIDLAADEDNIAEVDMNVVMLDTGEIVELQSTSEKTPISIEKLNELIKLASSGIKEIIGHIKTVVKELP